MKNFILLPGRKAQWVAGAFCLLFAPMLRAQNGNSTEAKTSETKYKVVTVIDGKTTVKEYDGGELGEAMKWFQNDGPDGESVIRIHAGAGDSDAPVRVKESYGTQIIVIDDEAQESDAGDRSVFIKKLRDAQSLADGEMRIQTIQVINGDTLINETNNEGASDFEWEVSSGAKGGGTQVMVVKTGRDCDNPNEQDIEVMVQHGGDADYAYTYNVIVRRECKSVKMEEPASGDLAKFEGQAGDELRVQSLEAFPNPNEGQFTLRFELQDEAPAELRIFNLEGKQVYAEELGGRTRYEKQVDIGEVPAGVYLLRILQGGASVTKRLVVE
ncbi:MAG: T9SS type A sorting domain-containing protein [Bacteroidota bacterium]